MQEAGDGASQDQVCRRKSLLPLAGEVGRGPAAVRPGKVLAGQETASRPGPRIAVRGRFSLAGYRMHITHSGLSAARLLS